MTGHINRIEFFSVTTGSVTCWGLESMSPFSFTSQLGIPNCISRVKFFPALGKNHTRKYVFGDLTQCLFPGFYMTAQQSFSCLFLSMSRRNER